MSVRILNANLLSITRIELLQSLKRGVLVTPNLDHLVKLQHDREFYDLYQKAEWVVCDSKILYLCSRLLKKGIPEAIPGSSFFTAFYQYHKDNPDCRIFLWVRWKVWHKRPWNVSMPRWDAKSWWGRCLLRMVLKINRRKMN